MNNNKHCKEAEQLVCNLTSVSRLPARVVIALISTIVRDRHLLVQLRGGHELDLVRVLVDIGPTRVDGDGGHRGERRSLGRVF